jgi:hypothetical protein
MKKNKTNNMKQLTPEQMALIEEAKRNLKANTELLAEVDKTLKK